MSKIVSLFPDKSTVELPTQPKQTISTPFRFQCLQSPLTFDSIITPQEKVALINLLQFINSLKQGTENEQ